MHNFPNKWYTKIISIVLGSPILYLIVFAFILFCNPGLDKLEVVSTYFWVPVAYIGAISGFLVIFDIGTSTPIFNKILIISLLFGILSAILLLYYFSAEFLLVALPPVCVGIFHLIRIWPFKKGDEHAANN